MIALFSEFDPTVTRKFSKVRGHEIQRDSVQYNTIQNEKNWISEVTSFSDPDTNQKVPKKKS